MDNELLVREAARAGVVVEPLPSETEYCGVYVRDLNDGQEVWVVRMIFTWRILETHALGYGRFWCYPLEAFRVAVTHASLYGDGEPDGWIKSWDGRRATPTHEAIRLLREGRQQAKEE